MKTIKIIFLLQLYCNLSFGSDSIYCNIADSKRDRILLFDNAYFICIKESILNSDTMLNISFGKIKRSNDTIFFIAPDSTDKPNRFFRFCKGEYNQTKDFYLYSEKNENSQYGLDYVYKMLFKKKYSNYAEIYIESTDKAIHKGNMLEFISNKEKYVLRK